MSEAALASPRSVDALLAAYSEEDVSVKLVWAIMGVIPGAPTLSIYRSLDEARLLVEFKKDLEAVFGTAGNPKADLLYSKAWDLGHDNGLNEVLTYYNDFVELIR